MLTRETFILLKNGVAVHGEEQLKYASRVAAVIEKYAAELVEVEVGEGENKRTLKWNELPELYKECFVQAMLMEFGWQEAKKDDRKESDRDEPVENKTAANTDGGTIWGWRHIPGKPILPLGWGAMLKHTYVGGAKDIWTRFVQYVGNAWSKDSKEPLSITIDKSVVASVCNLVYPEEIRQVLSDVAEMFQEVTLEHRQPDGSTKCVCNVFQTVVYNEDEDNPSVYAEASDMFVELVKEQLGKNESECAGPKDE